MIGRKAEIVLNRAVRYAVEQDHEYFTLEHVLWSLLRESEIIEIVDACGGEPVRMRSELEEYLDAEIPKAERSVDESESESGSESDPESGYDPEGGGPGSASSEGERDEAARDEAGWEHPIATLSIQRLIQSALFHVQSAGKDEIRPADLLVALFQARESHALHLLAKQGIDRLDVLNFISHGIQKDVPRSGAAPASSARGDSTQGDPSEDAGGTGEGSGFLPDRTTGMPPEPGIPGTGGKGLPGRSVDDPLVLYAHNLNDRAEAGKIDPLIGRKHEVDRMIQTLCRRQKSNPLLVGEAGVGKTALAEGLAGRIVNGDVPEHLANSIVYALDLGALLAGAKFRGDFEQRLKKVLSALQKQKDQGHAPILLIDEIHTIIGAGAVSGGALDAANLLKPILAQGELRCIGSTTYQEYRNVFEKDHALARRFQKIDVPEPTSEEAIQILSGLKTRFEEHHGVEYTPDALRAAVELSAKHLTDRFLPDKAIDVIDEAGAKARLKAGIRKKKSASTKIGPEEIEEVIAQIARIPAKSVSTSQKTRLRSLERDLKFTIYGQDHAIEALVTAIRLARSGLRTAERPVGAFLFCGPTGVGKTELSKQLGQCLGVPFLRFDMSEYSEKHTVSRLIGAPPGYVGFEQAGLLTDAVLKNPHSVVLLDEIEKAHADIWNILLQVMDHGVLTDNNGRKADFRNTILILTSNVGSREMERRPLGVGSQDNANPASLSSETSGAKRAVEQTFSPEFRNRLDAIVYFNALDPVAVGQVVGKQLLELESQLLAKGVELEVSADVRDWLANKGYDRRMGARPMARLIQDHLKKPLAEEILFGKLEGGGSVRVLMSGEKVSFEFTPKKPAKGTAGARERASEPVSSGTRPEG